LWQACKDPDGVSSRSQLRDPGWSAQRGSAPDVCASAKGVSGACEHQYTDVAPFSDLAQDTRKLIEDGRSRGVQLLRPIKRDGSHRTGDHHVDLIRCGTFSRVHVSHLEVTGA
jgi:hypothetical protein